MVDLDAAPNTKDTRCGVVCRTGPARRGDEINVVQLSEDELPGLELGLYRAQRWFQCQAEACGH